MTRNLDDLVSTIRSRFWIEDISQVRSLAEQVRPVSSTVLGAIARRVALASEGQRKGTMLNWIVLGVLCDQERFLRIVRRQGLLRSSRFFKYNSSVPGFVVKKLLHKRVSLALSDDTTQYLESVQALAEFSRYPRSLHRVVAKALTGNPLTLLRTLLAHVEYAFLHRDLYAARASEGLAPEQLACGFSYLFYLVSERRAGEIDVPMAIVDPELILSGKTAELLQQAQALREYAETEVRVDHLNYRCRYDADDRRLVVQAPSDDFEQAFRLGFIKRDIVSFLAEDPEPPGASLSLREAGEKLTETLGERFIVEVAKPVRRLVLNIPLGTPLEKIWRADALFREEIEFLRAAALQHLVTPKELLDYTVVGTVTLRDVLLFQRFCAILRWAVARKLRPFIDSKDNELVFNSLIPAYKRDESADIFSVILPPEKTRQILELLSWHSSERVFDLLYQPIIRGSREYQLPLNIIASSYLLRNILMLRQQRVNDGIETHPMDALLRDAFEYQGFKVATQIEYKWEKGQGDIDVCCRSGRHLFVFETKYALIPTDAFEERGTFDHMCKAREQLDRVHLFLNQADNLKRLCDRLGWEGTEPDTEVHTCIVMSNGMFPGYWMGLHPVRPFLDLLMFVAGNEVSLGDKRKSFRPTGRLQGDDLVAFLAGDEIHHAFVRAMYAASRRFEIGGATIVYESFALDYLTLLREFGVDVDGYSSEELEALAKDDMVGDVRLVTPTREEGA